MLNAVSSRLFMILEKKSLFMQENMFWVRLQIRQKSNRFRNQACIKHQLAQNQREKHLKRVSRFVWKSVFADFVRL